MQVRLPTSRGFTLIEVVVALGLGVLLLAGVQSIVVHAYRIAVQLENREAARAAQQLPFELLAADLAQRPLTGDVALRDGCLSFVTLNALQSACPAARHAVAVRYWIERPADGTAQLVRQERELGAPAAWTGAVLADGLAEAAFEIGDGRDWAPRWPPPTLRAARAVRLTLRARDGSVATRLIQLAPLHWSRHDG